MTNYRHAVDIDFNVTNMTVKTSCHRSTNSIICLYYFVDIIKNKDIRYMFLKAAYFQMYYSHKYPKRSFIETLS